MCAKEGGGERNFRILAQPLYIIQPGIMLKYIRQAFNEMCRVFYRYTPIIDAADLKADNISIHAIPK